MKCKYHQHKATYYQSFQLIVLPVGIMISKKISKHNKNMFTNSKMRCDVVIERNKLLQ